MPPLLTRLRRRREPTHEAEAKPPRDDSPVAEEDFCHEPQGAAPIAPRKRPVGEGVAAEESFPDPGPPDPGATIDHKPVDLNELARERTRQVIVWITLIAAALEFPIAVAAVLAGGSWDIGAYALAPIVALASVIGYSYFK